MIGVIADDLTGAGEIGAIGWRRGLQAEIVCAGEPSPDADLVCIDTDSRSVTSDEAGRRAAAAAKLLRRAGAEWIYKKVDSVLRGHVVAELEAVLEQLHLDSALLVPANPRRDRVIRQGRYFVAGRTIDKTEFRRDPEFPRRSADVLELMGAKGARSVQVRGVHAGTASSGIVVGEAESAADLRHWAGQPDSSTLLSGAAEFFEAILNTRAIGSSIAPESIPSPTLADRILFLCGTLSAASAQFVALARKQEVPVFALPERPSRGAAPGSTSEDELVARIVRELQFSCRIVLTTSPRVYPDPEASRDESRRLVRLGSAVMHNETISHVYVEGGATAALLFRHVGITRLKVVREVAPGVVTLSTSDGQGPIFTLKPGSYVWPDEIQAKLGV